MQTHKKPQCTYNLHACTPWPWLQGAEVLSTHCCILGSGHSFGASERLCVCTSAGRGHAARTGAHREAKKLLRLPAMARSRPGNCGCSSTHSKPQPCEYPHLCAVRSHNQRLEKQKGIDTHKHTEMQTLGKKCTGFLTQMTVMSHAIFFGPVPLKPVLWGTTCTTINQWLTLNVILKLKVNTTTVVSHGLM